jgi:hypothetical protein
MISFQYEGRDEPLLPRRAFLQRLGYNAGFAFVVLAVSLFLGMLGYRLTEGLDWLDAFVESAMLLGGMGPVHAPTTTAGKLFAGVFALYAGILVIGTAGVILAPVFHRVLHSFHVQDDDDEKQNERQAGRPKPR